MKKSFWLILGITGAIVAYMYWSAKQTAATAAARVASNPLLSFWAPQNAATVAAAQSSVNNSVNNVAAIASGVKSLFGFGSTIFSSSKAQSSGSGTPAPQVSNLVDPNAVTFSNLAPTSFASDSSLDYGGVSDSYSGNNQDDSSND